MATALIVHQGTSVEFARDPYREGWYRLSIDTGIRDDNGDVSLPAVEWERFIVMMRQRMRLDDIAKVVIEELRRDVP